MNYRQLLTQHQIRKMAKRGGKKGEWIGIRDFFRGRKSDINLKSSLHITGNWNRNPSEIVFQFYVRADIWKRHAIWFRHFWPLVNNNQVLSCNPLPGMLIKSAIMTIPLIIRFSLRHEVACIWWQVINAFTEDGKLRCSRTGNGAKYLFKGNKNCHAIKIRYLS